MKDWYIPFNGREDEIKIFNNFFSSEKKDSPTSRLVIHGDSGTGKSYFLKNNLFNAITANNNIYSLYIDLANDSFQNSRVLSSILTLSLIPTNPSLEYPINIPEKKTYSNFKKIDKKRAFGKNLFKGLSKTAASLVQVESLVKPLFDISRNGNNKSIEEIFTDYFLWISKQSQVIIAIDNYQFLNYEIRILLESIFLDIKRNIKLIIVDRTIDGISEIVPPIQNMIHRSDAEITIKTMTKSETYKIVKSIIYGNEQKTKKLSDDIFTKTEGNAKDIEYCLRKYIIELNNGTNNSDILGLIATIDKLPSIHRQLLLISALLDGGVAQELAFNTINKISSIVKDTDFDKVLNDLIELQYVKINSLSGDRIRPGHERIVYSIREIGTDDFFEDVRSSLLSSIEDLLEKGSSMNENEAYLLHCFIGLQTFNELKKNLHFVSRLIKNQHRQDQYTYITNFCYEAYEILPLLSDETLIKILDSFQKCSSFEKGLLLISILEKNYKENMQDLLIYKYKFLVQQYQYDAAINVAEHIKDSPWKQVYILNILLALCKDEKAKQQINIALYNHDIDEPIAVILRNSVTLFPPEIALNNLSKAQTFFEKTNSDYKVATIDTNRGLIYLCIGNTGDASKVLNRAVKRMGRIDSKEIYQAYINLGILYLVERKYELSSKFMNLASDFIPKSLLLDQIKNELNIAILLLVSKKKTIQETLKKHVDLLNKINGIEMPYIRMTLNHNISQLDGKTDSDIDNEHKDKFAGEKNISLLIPIKYEDKTFIVNPSVHWRY